MTIIQLKCRDYEVGDVLDWLQVAVQMVEVYIGTVRQLTRHRKDQYLRYVRCSSLSKSEEVK